MCHAAGIPRWNGEWPLGETIGAGALTDWGVGLLSLGMQVGPQHRLV